MVEYEVIYNRLERLRGYLKILKSLKKFSKKQFIEDPFIYGVADRFLHLSIECLIDIGNHIISDSKFRKPSTYNEVFEILYKEKVISKTLFAKIADMAAFRNILVHDYLDIDHNLVYEVIKNKLSSLEELAIKFGKYIA